MASLPDELWRRILELGIQTLSLSFKDLCRFSISCSRFRMLSNEDSLWSALLHHDFVKKPDLSCSCSSPFKSLYQARFERDRVRKLAAHRRVVLRMESQVAEHSWKLGALELHLDSETQKLNTAVSELSNLRNVRHSSVALNVWQPEIIRSCQKQIVEQCAVPVDSRISALEMELKLCKKQISSLHKAYGNEKKRLETAKEQLASMKYHPLRDYKLESGKVDESKIKKRKLKRSIDWHS